MKNVFFALAIMLVGTFVFANTEPATTPEVDVEKIESLILADELELSAEEVELVSCGFPVYYDDGGSGDWDGFGVDYYSFDCGQSTYSFCSDFFSWLYRNFP